MLENPRKFKNSPNLLLLFVKITKFLEFSKKITIKTIVFSNSDFAALPLDMDVGVDVNYLDANHISTSKNLFFMTLAPIAACKILVFVYNLYTF